MQRRIIALFRRWNKTKKRSASSSSPPIPMSSSQPSETLDSATTVTAEPASSPELPPETPPACWFVPLLVGMVAFVGLAVVALIGYKGAEINTSVGDCKALSGWLSAYGGLFISILVYIALCCFAWDGGLMIASLFLFAFGWCCHGMSLIYNDPGLYSACSPSQTNTFRFTVMFGFYGGLVAILAIIFGICALLGVCKNVSLRSIRSSRLLATMAAWFDCLRAVCHIFLVIILIFAVFFVIPIILVVFGIQALVVGAATYIACYEVGVWLIVFGSLTVVGALISLVGFVPFAEDPDKRIVVILQLLALILVAWLCYGMYLVYDNPGVRMACSPSQFGVFALMVKFCFYFGVAFTLGWYLVDRPAEYLNSPEDEDERYCREQAERMARAAAEQVRKERSEAQSNQGSGTGTTETAPPPGSPSQETVNTATPKQENISSDGTSSEGEAQAVTLPSTLSAASVHQQGKDAQLTSPNPHETENKLDLV